MPTELSWTSNEMWILTMSVLALVVAVSSLVYTIWSNHKFRRADALQKVREKVTTNAERFFNTNLFGDAQGNPFSLNKDHAEAAKGYYLEVTSAYKAHKHLFKKAAQSEIDAALKEVEKVGFPIPQLFGGIGAMNRAIALIQKTLQRY